MANPLDTGGNVAVDFVWGNFPLQPNDARGTALDAFADTHNIVPAAWNGYPGYASPNGGGSITVPSVLTQTLAVATATLAAAGLKVGTTSSTAGGGVSGQCKQQTPTAATVLTDPYSGSISVDLVFVT